MDFVLYTAYKEGETVKVKDYVGATVLLFNNVDENVKKNLTHAFHNFIIIVLCTYESWIYLVKKFMTLDSMSTCVAFSRVQSRSF